MKKKLLATLLTLGAFCCSTAAFAGCNINGGTENGGGNDSAHTSHIYQNYHDNGNGTCTGTCTGCSETDTSDHVYDDAADTTCNNCGYVREVGGGEEPGDETVSVTKLMINKSTLSLVKGESQTITATVLPSNATNKSVSWASDNPSVATVDDEGNVTAVATGTAHITVTTADGNKTKTCTVTVTTEQQQPTTVSVTGVELNKTALSLKAGANETLTATVLPADATNKEVGWSSDNPSVATVDDEGKVTAKAAGTANITVTTADGNKTKTCTVTVTAEQQQPTTVRVTGVQLSKTTLSLAVGDTETLTATVAPSDAANKSVNWESSNTSVATVNASGDITPKGAGTTTITVTTVDGNFTATCTVTVTANQQQPDKVSVTGVSLDKTTLSLSVGGTETLNATVAPSDATNKNVSWSSNNESVATVNATGKVSAVGSGTAQITVTTADGNRTATCTVTVKTAATVPAEITYSYAGEECAAFEWNDTSITTKTQAEYKLHSAGDGTYKQIDSELIRLMTDEATGNTYVRADIVGLKGGEVYDFRLTTSSGSKLIATNMSIYSYDRSGYAHFNAEGGVGGYNDDGTLKNNAIVVYVNEDNKNNVVVNGSATGKSIVEYLGSISNNSKPIVVRILGTVGAATWNELEHNNGVGKSELYKELVGANGENLAEFYKVSKTGSSKSISQAQLIEDGFNTLNTTEYAELKGLSSKIKFSPKVENGVDKSEFDSCWNDCSLQNLKNVTVEGIGEDAKIFQWGFTWKTCNYIEVRNLTFDDYTEDACSFEGSKTSASSESQFVERHFWIHHNVFEQGKNYWDVCNEQDKHDGDGSTDFKGVSGVTISYNVYHKCHKTGLVGGSNSQTTANVTFHHNYYNNCGSRLPLARQANMHMYNNYYYKSTGTNMSLRAGAYALIENCYFDNANVPIEIQTDSTYGTGAAKVLDCTFDGKNYSANSRIYDNNAANSTINRASKVTNDNRFNKEFDTDPDAFYYDTVNLRTNVTQMMATASVKTVIPKVAGVQKRNDDFTLAITGNNAPCGVKEEGGDNPALTKFEELSARADCVYTNNFDSIANGTKLAAFENYSTAGIYSLPNEASAYASNHTAVTDGKAVQVVTNTVNTTTAIAFGNLSGKSSVEGYFEMSTSAVGSKWDIIRFMNTSGMQAAVRIHKSASEKLTYYTPDTPTESDGKGGTIPSAITPSKSFVWAANTTYKVYFTVDLTSGEIYISITGSGATFEATITQSATDICGINLISSSSGARLVTLDNLVICVS